MLYEPSCVVIKLKAISLRNSEAYVLSSIKFNVYGNINEQNMKYSLYSKVPGDDIHTLVVNVVVNVGWCQNKKDAWVRSGDYISMKLFQVKSKRNKNSYVKNIMLKCHCKYLSFVLFYYAYSR